MTNEPMINYEERAPLILVGILLFVFILMKYGSPEIGYDLDGWCVLVPLGTGGATTYRQFVSLFGHGLLHANWGHILMNGAMILVFSVMVLRGLRARNNSLASLRYWFVFIASVAFGGLCQWGWWAATQTELAAAVGASGGASGLFAAAGWAIGGRKTVMQYGMAWILINVIFIVAEPILGVSMAWPAHLGGYLMGAVLAPLWMKPSSTGFSITR